MQAQFAGGLAGVSAAVASFKAASAEGFGINEQGGWALISAINTLNGKIDDHLLKADELALQLPLGTTPAAQAYKPFLATIASDPVQGLIPALTKLQTELSEIRTEVEKSMATYQASDQSGRQGFSQAGGST